MSQHDAQDAPPTPTPHEIRFGAAERLTFFTDAVAAIAITLLAIELPVPDGDTTAEILHSAREHFNEYLAFVISFLVIAAHWRFHHGLFRFVRHVSSQVVSINFGWLFLLIITPFTTKLISFGHDDALRFGTYAATEALQFGIFAVLILVILRQKLLHPGVDPARVRRKLWNVLPLSGAFAVSIPFHLLIGSKAFWIWALVPIVTGSIERRRLGQRSDLVDG